VSGIIERDDYDTLMRAAKVVPIYERDVSVNPPPALLGPGCFDCNHDVPSMNQERAYGTLNIYQGGPFEGSHRLTVVVSLDDSFYQERAEHWMHSVFNHTSPTPGRWISELDTEDIDETDLDVYVRIVYNAGLETEEHVNTRVNIRDYLVDGGSTYLTMVGSGVAHRGQYVDPTMLMKDSSPYTIENMLLHPQFVPYFKDLMGNGGLGGGPRLERVGAEETVKVKASAWNSEVNVAYEDAFASIDSASVEY